MKSTFKKMLSMNIGRFVATAPNETNLTKTNDPN